MITLKVLRLYPDVQLPAYAREGDSGLDVRARASITLERFLPCKLTLGIACELPYGYELQIRPRSSLSGAGILCQWGTVDNGYRGDMAVVLIALAHDYEIAAGDKIAQLVPAAVTRVKVQDVDKLSETERGARGFGSTGR